jgi:hypothetical protein
MKEKGSMKDYKGSGPSGSFKLRAPPLNQADYAADKYAYI